LRFIGHIENKASQKVLLKNTMNKSSVNGSLVQYSLTKKESEENSKNLINEPV
jgi:hypothetical protein